MQIVINVDRVALKRLVFVLTVAGLGAALLTQTAGVFAAPLNIPYSFSSGTTISSAEMNANFGAVSSAVNTNINRIGDLGALQTTATSDLVAAINEARLTEFQCATGNDTFDGGGGNSWTDGTIMASTQVGGETRVTPGNPYTLVVHIQTCDVNTAAPGAPGIPLAGGALAFDVQWHFRAGSVSTKTVTQSNVGSMTIDPGVNNDKTVTITGTMPALPLDDQGFQCDRLGYMTVTVNGANTTAQGQSKNGAFLRFVP